MTEGQKCKRSWVLSHMRFVFALLCVRAATRGCHVPRAAVGRASRCPLVRAHLNQDRPVSALATLGSQFDEALGSLPPKEKYNAVLEGLLSGGGANPAQAIELIAEMNGRRIKMSSQALKALIDSMAAEGQLPQLLSALNVARQNGMCKAFASPQLSALPTTAATIGALTELPIDSRSLEIGTAAAFLAMVGALLALSLADLLDFLIPFGNQFDDVSAPPIQFVFAAAAVLWATDRYSLRGEVLATLGRGIRRLVQRDLQRETLTESAAFTVGYLLGLPCMAYQPTAIRPLELLSVAAEPMEKLHKKGVARLLDRLLVWQLAPVAAEHAHFGDCMVSDPTIAAQMLKAARRRQAWLGIDLQQGGWGEGEGEDKQRLRWAYGEAKALLKRYAGVREEVQEQMAAGVSAGECVAIIEERLKNQWGAV